MAYGQGWILRNAFLGNFVSWVAAIAWDSLGCGAACKVQLLYITILCLVIDEWREAMRDF